MKPKILINYAILCLIWGTTWIILKKSLICGTPPFFGSGFRFFFGGIILWGVILYKRDFPSFKALPLQLYVQFGLLNLTICYGLTYWATQFIYSSLSALIWAGFPLCVAVFSYFMLPDEVFTKKKIISLFLGTIGALLILREGLNFKGDQVVIGIFMVVIAVIIAGYPNVYLKRYSNAVTSLHLNAVSQLIAGITLLVISFVFESDQKMVWNNFNIFALAYLTIFGFLFPWFFYFCFFPLFSMPQTSIIAFFPLFLYQIFRAHETRRILVCRLRLEKKKNYRLNK